MTIKHITLALVAAAALAGCNKQDHTINGDEMADRGATDVAAIDPASLPPSIAATKTYRCKDNSVVTIDWLSDKLSANLRATADATPVQVKTADAATPLTAEGYSVTGNVDSSSVTVTSPGKAAQSCDV